MKIARVLAFLFAVVASPVPATARFRGVVIEDSGTGGDNSKNLPKITQVQAIGVSDNFGRVVFAARDGDDGTITNDSQRMSVRGLKQKQSKEEFHSVAKKKSKDGKRDKQTKKEKKHDETPKEKKGT
eukprot:jgi/Psemu1/282042/fgenesh1_pg.2_\